MTGAELKTARNVSNWTQSEAANWLGVTQAYLSMVERGARPVSEELAAIALGTYSLPPTARPFGVHPQTPRSEEFFKNALGELGYPGFAYLKGRTGLNPAELLLVALDTEDLDSRVTEALPWLPFRFPEMDWHWLIAQVKVRDRQNRLAFIAELARQVAESRNEPERAEVLAAELARLERSRLAGEDTLCKASMTEAERRWLRSHRTEAAVHWNLLTDLKLEDLSHVDRRASS